MDLIEQYGAEYVLLARHAGAQRLGLPPAAGAGDQHPPLLPARLRGARPYEQAFARGVKLIGATAHFVTSDLDEGPIIEQALERVDHTCLPDKLLNVGRHIESMVLERAVQLVTERRVFVSGLRTVILR